MKKENFGWKRKISQAGGEITFAANIRAYSRQQLIPNKKGVTIGAVNAEIKSTKAKIHLNLKQTALLKSLSCTVTSKISVFELYMFQNS